MGTEGAANSANKTMLSIRMRLLLRKLNKGVMKTESILLPSGHCFLFQKHKEGKKGTFLEDFRGIKQKSLQGPKHIYDFFFF